MEQADSGVVDPVVEDTGNLATLVDQVVAKHTPIVVARAGEPKAALVSMDDYSRLKQEAEAGGRKLAWGEWLLNARQLRQDILASRGGEPIDGCGS